MQHPAVGNTTDKKNLKGLCLANLGDISGALEVCDRIRTAQPSSEDTYQNILDILKSQATVKAVQQYLTKTMEAGYMVCKTESMGRLWFFTAVRTGDFAMQKRAAVELKKGFLAKQYFYWVIMSMLSIARRSQDVKEVTMLDMLLYPMMAKAADNAVQGGSDGPKIATVEELYLFLDILERQNRYEQMLDVLDGRLGQAFGNSRDLKCLKLEILIKLGKQDAVLAYAQNSISAGIDDWHFQKCLIHASEKPCERTRSRNDLLAIVAWSAHHKKDLLEDIKVYLKSFGATLALYEDLLPYTNQLDHLQQLDLFAHMEALLASRSSGKQAALLQVNLAKFRFCHRFATSRDTADLESFAKSCLASYADALSLGDALEATDNQYGDDLLLVVVQILLEPLSQLDQSDIPLLQSAAILEYGLARAKHNFQFKLYLVRIYRLLGAWRLAEDIFKSLSIKQVQRDTLAYILYEDATFEQLSAKQILGLQTTQTPYISNQEETPEMLCLAFEKGTYSKIEEFLLFGDRLKYSYWRFRSTAEIAHLELLLDKKPSAVMEPIERVFDNRSKDVTHHYLPIAVAPARALSFRGTGGINGAISSENISSLKAYQSRVLQLRSIISGSAGSLQSDDPDGVLFDFQALSLAVQGSSADNLKTHLESLTLPAFDAVWSRETLIGFGSVLEHLKVVAAVLSRLTKVQRKSMASSFVLARNKTAALVAGLTAQRGRIQSRARTQVASVRASGLFSVLKNADEGYVEQILDRIAAAQAESLYALINAAKLIRI